MEIFEAARHVHGPGRVAEVSAELAGHGRSGERGERHAELGVEALDRFEDPESRDLDEVVHRLATTAEPHRLAAGEVEVLLDQAVADRPVTGSAVLAEEVEIRRRLSFHG